MITTTLPILNLKRGIRVNEFSSVEELDKEHGTGSALSLANQYIRVLLREQAKVAIVAKIEETSGLVRQAHEEVTAFVRRWMKETQATETGLQMICDEIKPLSYGAKRVRTRPDHRTLESAQRIFDNQNEGKWKALLETEGISIPAFTGNRDNDIAILAAGLKRYWDKQMEREFV